MDVKSHAPGYEPVSDSSRAERGGGREHTVVFLPSAALLPLSATHPMVASVRGSRVSWTGRGQLGTGDARVPPRADC